MDFVSGHGSAILTNHTLGSFGDAEGREVHDAGSGIQPHHR
jgi:hypothetical protein